MGKKMICLDCIHVGLCYKANDYDNFPDKCGDFISYKALEERPTNVITEEQAIDKLHETGWLIMHDKEMTERLLDIDIETLDHRLRLLIGVLYSNNLVSKNDLEYIEDSIKKYMKEEENGKEDSKI